MGIPSRRLVSICRSTTAQPSYRLGGGRVTRLWVIIRDEGAEGMGEKEPLGDREQRKGERGKKTDVASQL